MKNVNATRSLLASRTVNIILLLFTLLLFTQIVSETIWTKLPTSRFRAPADYNLKKESKPFSTKKIGTKKKQSVQTTKKMINNIQKESSATPKWVDLIQKPEPSILSAVHYSRNSR